MKRRTRLMLSALTGVAAAAIALLYVSGVQAEASHAQQEAAERYGGELVAVCVATREIAAGETIDEGNVRVEEWVSSLLPSEALTSLQDAVGKTASSRIPERAPLCEAYFTRREAGIDVPRGKVAVSVACDAEHALGGAVARGDEVDVYLARDAVANRLCAAQIVDTSALADGGGDMTWATLAVDASAVRELLAAASSGSIVLAAPGAPEAEVDGGAD